MALTEAEELELLELEAAQGAISENKNSYLQNLLDRARYYTINALQGGALETVGALGGGVGGTTLGSAAGGVGAVPGGVAGSALGAAAGKNLEDILLTYMGINKPKSLKNEALDVGKAGLRGATSEMTGQVTGKILAKAGEKILDPAGRLLKEKAAPRLMTSAVKDADLANEMLARNEWGTAKSLLNNAGKQVEGLSNQVDDILSKSDAKIDPNKIVGALEQLRKEYAQLPGREHEVEVIQSLQQKIIKSLPEEQVAKGFVDYTNLPVKAGSDLKKSIYSENKKLYQGGNYDPASIRAQTDMRIARGLKESVEDAAPEIADINSELGHNIQVRDTMETILDKSGKANIVQLKPLLAGLGLLSQGAAPAVAGPVASNLVESTLGRTGLAVGAKKAGEKLMERSGTPITGFLARLLMQRNLQN